MNPHAEYRERLARAFRWRGDRNDPDQLADVTQWWREPELLAGLGPALATLHGELAPSVVMGPQSRGSMLGVLTAVALGVGFAEVRKNADRAADSDLWW